MRNVHYKFWCQFIWIGSVIIFTFYFIFSQKTLIFNQMQSLNWPTVPLALLFILFAKFGLVENMRLSIAKSNLQLTFKDCYSIYNNTQLAKYIPGYIWHFLGRIAILRSRGANIKTIRDSMVAEYIWIVCSALLVGIICIASNDGNSIILTNIKQQLKSIPGILQILLLVGIVAISAGLLFFFVNNLKLLCLWTWTLRPGFRAISVMILVWICLGSSLWLTVGGISQFNTLWVYCIGVYSLSYAVGFIVPISPAGIGIREGILIFYLSPTIGIDNAIFVAGLNRLLYIIAELLLVASCVILRYLPTSSK